MIYYLAHPYTGMEYASYRFACQITKELRKKGFAVFSPILHTHSYCEDTACFSETEEDENYLGDEDWVAWDLMLLQGFKDVTVLLSTTAYLESDSKIWLSEGCRREYDFAKQHQIRVLSMEAFLEGKEIDL